MASRLDIGAVFRETASVSHAEASRLLPLALIAVVVPAGVAAVTASYLTNIPAALIDSAVTTSGAVLFAGVAKETVRRRRVGDARASLGTLIAMVRPVFLRLVSAAVLTGLGVAVGLLAFLIPGLLLLTWWAVVAPVIAVEHTGVLGAFRRSRALVKGNAPRVFAVLAIIFAAMAVTAGLTAGIFELVGVGHEPDVALEIGEALALPVEGVAVALMYFALLEIERARGQAT